MAIPAGRRYSPDEPEWFRKRCRRGHALRLYGRQRTDGPGAHCRKCSQLRAEERRRGGYVRPPSEPRPPREVDWVVVDRLVRGRHLPYVHGQDRHAAVELLYAKGWGIIRTAQQIGTTPRTVARIRARIRKGLPYGTTSTEHGPAGRGVRAADPA